MPLKLKMVIKLFEIRRSNRSPKPLTLEIYAFSFYWDY